MKYKLLYLLPLALIVLNALPYALYKDTVALSGEPPVLESLTPAHWKLQAYDASFSGGLTPVGTDTKISSVLSTDAAFKGFPFGAYFQSDKSSSTANSQSSSSVTAWSWLWGAVDGLILLAVLLFVMRVNWTSRHFVPVNIGQSYGMTQSQVVTSNSHGIVTPPIVSQPPAVGPQVISPEAPAAGSPPNQSTPGSF